MISFAFIVIIATSILNISTVKSQYQNDMGSGIFRKPKKARVDLGPAIYEENEVQILTDNDWDENLLNHEVYLVLFYRKGDHNPPSITLCSMFHSRLPSDGNIYIGI